MVTNTGTKGFKMVTNTGPKASKWLPTQTIVLKMVTNTELCLANGYRPKGLNLDLYVKCGGKPKDTAVFNMVYMVRCASGTSDFYIL